MTWVRATLVEVWGLFVDDGRFALSILAWLLIGWILPRLGLPTILSCILFAAGPAALLIADTLLRAGKRR